MKRVLITVLVFLFMQELSAQFTVSDNKHFLLRDNKPFFWLGDTAWELFHRLDREEADRYLKRRSEQGFTVVQAVALAELSGLTEGNAYGQLPLINGDPLQPNEKYFEHVDYIIDKAESYGIVIGLLPTWGDKVFKDTWGAGPEIFNTENAADYAGWLARRYKDKKNIIWITGGDRTPRNEKDVAIWRAMGRAIKKATDGKAMITFHPQPNQLGSAEWLHADEWLGFNMFQNGHCRDVAVYDKINLVYNKRPLKPVMDGEPLYEDHPVCFNVKDLGTSSAYDVRKLAYLELFAGAHGHTYGCHDVWQMYSSKYKGVNAPHYYWYEALELPGANQMGFVRKLMESHAPLERVPDQSIIRENNLCAAERIQATRGGDYLYVYSAAGKPFTVVGGKIKGGRLRAYWFDPRNGKSTDIGVSVTGKDQLFTPPSTGYGQDWVLVIEEATKEYAKP